MLDLTRIIAGPWCTQQLAEMGATVYKIERPGIGDDMRHLKPTLSLPDGSPAMDSTSHLGLNRSKHSITVDISQPAGQRIVLDLAAKCDVFVENYNTGNLARLGLDYERIKALNPGIVYCSITGYGQDGPLASQPGYDPIFQAVTGLMSTCGIPDSMPGAGLVRTTIPFVDVMTGMTATTAIMGALYHRKGTGKGQFVDVALLDVAFASAGPYAQTFLITGKAPERVGNCSTLFAPSNCFHCAGDGYILIQVVNEAQWRRLCDVLGRPDWAEDPRFAANASRVLNLQELHRQLETMTRKRDARELAATLGATDVPCGPVILLPRPTIARRSGIGASAWRWITRCTDRCRTCAVRCVFRTLPFATGPRLRLEPTPRLCFKPSLGWGMRPSRK